MFGYVVPNQAALSDEAQKRYRTALSLIHISEPTRP